MMLVVDPWDWLDPDGELPSDARLRRRVLGVLRVVEYGSRLPPGSQMETLIECARRPSRRPCGGLLVVHREFDDSLFAFCPKCGSDVMLVHDWHGTRWSIPSDATPIPPPWGEA
jgi:hypothetical protein